MDSGIRVKKIYHHYEKWEEYKAGMWENPSKDEIENLVPQIIEFTGNHIEYGKAMLEVIKNWKFSCEDKLTDIHLNRRAWLGHAACCFKFGWKESLVRIAWNKLTNKQRFLANKEADKCINFYINYLHQKNQKNQLTLFNEVKNREIHKRMGAEML